MWRQIPKESVFQLIISQKNALFGFLNAVGKVFPFDREHEIANLLEYIGQ